MSAAESGHESANERPFRPRASTDCSSDEHLYSTHHLSPEMSTKCLRRFGCVLRRQHSDCGSTTVHDAALRPKSENICSRLNLTGFDPQRTFHRHLLSSKDFRGRQSLPMRSIIPKCPNSNSLHVLSCFGAWKPLLSKRHHRQRPCPWPPVAERLIALPPAKRWTARCAVTSKRFWPTVNRSGRSSP
jgi:hypothetical protein